ncbi:MAG TPA: hypothetical protein VH120_03570 [Gemmataceae bacterium]|jgi:hypothetical protein|nr:hypothetical protein [Gemmataceae bacterium]
MARTRSRFDRDEDTGPRSDVYTGLLALSLIAMIVSCLLLFLDYSQYGSTKAPTVTIPPPKVREGVQTGQLPPLLLPPPAPVGERPFTKGTETVAGPPVKPAGGEEASAPSGPAPKPEPPTAVVEPPPAPTLPAGTTPAAEPVAVPPTPEPPAKPAARAPVAPTPPPLPKSIRSLPN